MGSFQCACGTELVYVTQEEERGVYECPQCPLLEWRECLQCHQVTIKFPSLTVLCKACRDQGYFVVSGGVGPVIHVSAEEAIVGRQGPSIGAFDRAREIRTRARRRLGLSQNAKVPRKIEDICASLMRGVGCTFDGHGWSLPNSVALSL